jgi:nucleotide-binding universal stress UspA family protein
LIYVKARRLALGQSVPRDAEEKLMFRDMLVHVDASKASARRLGFAASLAERMEAHLTGLHVKWLQEKLYWADPVTAAMIVEAARDGAAADADAASAQFRAEMAGREIAAEWRERSGPLVRTLAAEGRLADLVIVGQHDPDGEAGIETDGLAEQVVLNSGRPCLVVPYAGEFSTLGRQILIAWDGSREASRAVHDALPFLRRAAKVYVVQVEPHPGGREFELPTDLARHLDRHGVAVELQQDVADGLPIADLLLSRAADLSIDLIVAGAYGHSRFRELILGGVTRSLFSEMTVPVLMSH